MNPTLSPFLAQNTTPAPGSPAPAVPGAPERLDIDPGAAPVETTTTTVDGTNTGTPVGPTRKQEDPGFFGGSFMWIMLLFLLAIYIMVMMGGRKEKKKAAAVQDRIKKNVRVQTVGGILGTVIDVRDNELVLKVDENSNTRIRLARTAVQTVLDDAEEVKK